MSSRVDILSPTANVDSNGLEVTLQSLDESINKGFRVLLINDSSDPLSKPRGYSYDIKVFNLGRNVGITKALNKAVRECSSDFIGRIDCGDTVSPLRFGQQMDYLDFNRNCVLVGTKTRLLWETEGRTELYKVTQGSDTIKNLNRHLLYTNPLAHGSIMFRTDIFKQIGGYDEQVHIAQDYNLYLRMKKHGSIYILPEVLTSHTFVMGRSNTYLKNRQSLLSRIRSRIRVLELRELLFRECIMGNAKDFCLLFLPMKLTNSLRRIYARLADSIRGK